MAQEAFYPLDYLNIQGVVVYSMKKANNGTLWLATSDGLFSYGQYLSNTPSTDIFAKTTHGIFINIYEDNTGKLWLMEQSNHYVIYDPATNLTIPDNRVEAYLKHRGVPVYYDFRIASDNKGCMWIYKGHELWLLDVAHRHVTYCKVPTRFGRIVGVTSERDKVLIATTHRIFLSPAGKMQLKIYATPPVPIDVVQDYLRMTMTHDGNVWLTTSQWMILYQRKTRSWKWVNNFMRTSFLTISLLPNDHLLVGTTREGIMEYDENGNLVNNYRANVFLKTSLQSNHIQSIYCDPQGKYLLVSYAKHGLSTFLTSQQRLFSLPVGIEGGTFLNDVITMCPGPKNTFFLGTEDNGVYMMDALHPDKPAIKQLFPGQTVTGLLMDKKGRLWAGLYSIGLACSDGRRFFPDTCPYNMVDLGNGKLLVILNGKGLNVLDMESGKTAHIKTDELWMQDVVSDKGYVYSTTTKDILIINKRTLRVKTVSKQIFGTGDDGISDYDLFLDSRGWLWMVRSVNHLPLRVYDTRSGKAYSFNEFKNYHVSSLCEDRLGRVWVSTDRGMICVTVPRHLSAAQPKLSLRLFGNVSTAPNYNTRAACLLPDGSMVEGTSDGFQFFNPEALCGPEHTKERLKRMLLLMGMRVNGAPYSRKPVHYQDSIVSLSLHDDERNVVLYTLPRDVNSAGVRNFYYRLDDEEGWQLIDNFRITLSRLSYGSHKISIEEMDPMSGARTEYLLATIHVAYPWYLSWWAVMTYILLGAGALFLTYYLYHRRQEYLFDLRERDMKLKFFTDISHALRMPLSLVMVPIEDLLLTVKDKETHQVLDLVHQNIKRLAFLVNKTLDFRKLEDAEMHQTVLYDDELAKQVVINNEVETPTNEDEKNEKDTILVVEDSVELLSFLAHVLGREYHVCQATDGQQALEILKTLPVDIIVSDVTMEGMNGLDLCHRVKTDIAFSHIPVILLTARSLASDELRGLEMGADDYITKPFNIDILRHRIRYLLDRTMTARERFAQATDVAASEITETTLDEQMLQKAMDIVKAHLSDTSFTADDLARELGMARTNVYKKLQFITGKTPAAFIRTIRLKHGRQMLEHDPKLFVSQVAYECGFANPKLFSRYFKDEFGIYPKEIKA